MVVWLFVSICFLMTELVNASWPDTNRCLPRSYGFDSIVCVCNSDYCDGFDVFPPLWGQYVVVSTSKDGARFNTDRGVILPYVDGQNQDVDVDKPGSLIVRVVINKDKKYQQIVGFGGAMTDSAGYNILSLPPACQNNLMVSYLGPGGISYNMIRVPMGSTDFSPRKATYDDAPNDINLTHFQLLPEDMNYKIPVMRAAAKIRGSPLTLLTAPWFLPAWMTNVNSVNSTLTLKVDQYQTLANYFLKFFQAYEMEGFEFALAAIGNQPLAGVPFVSYNATESANLITIIGKTLRNAGKQVSIMAGDSYYSPDLIDYLQGILEDPVASSYVSAVGLHGYDDMFTDFTYMDWIRNNIGNRMLLETEFSTGVGEISPVSLGRWWHATLYVINMIQTFNHGSMGYVDWNFAVDLDGGPNWYFNVMGFKNYLDAPIVVNATAGEFYKQPIFYAIGHFSKFVPPGSRRIDNEIFTADSNSEILVVTFETPRHEIVVVIYNPYSEQRIIRLEDQGVATITVASESITTVLYRNS